MTLRPFFYTGAMVIMGATNTINHVPTGSFDWLPVLNLGAVGAICAFVLYRLEPRMRAQERATDDNTRIIAVLLTQLPHVIEAVKQQAETMLKKLDREAAARGDKT